MTSHSYLLRPLIAFDLDGTIVDNEAAVRQAYHDVGVKMPQNAWGRPWQDWLAEPMDHHRKNVRYMELIRAGAVRPTTVAEFIMHYNIRAVILTGASAEAAAAVLEETLPRSSYEFGGTSMTQSDKTEYLEEHFEIKRYVDDDKNFVEKCNAMYKTPHDDFKALHYTGQNIEQLRKELLP